MSDQTTKASHLFLELPAFARTIVVVCLGALVVLCSLYISQFGWQLSDSRDHWGQFGDFIGGVLNPIIAIGALIGIWYSVALQRKELAETRKALQDQVSLSRVTVADQMLQSFFQAIGNCTQAISTNTTSSSTNLTITRSGDDAINDGLDQFSSDGMWEIGFSNLPADVKKYAEATLDSWTPLMNSIEQTVTYVNGHYDASYLATRLELMRFHLSLAKLHALCFFIRLNKDDALHNATRKANLLKNYPNGPIKTWFYHGETQHPI